MKQFQFEVKNHNNLRRELARVKRFCNNEYYNSVFFQIFTQITELDELKEITDIIENDFPEAYYYGCQTFGNIYDGCISAQKTVIVCSVFEYESTRTELIYIDPINTNARFQSLDDLWLYCNENKWVKGIELTASYKAAELLGIGKAIHNLREDVQIFGGIAIAPHDMSKEETYIFSKEHGISQTSMIAVLLGGPDLHVRNSYISGWEGLGKSFTITKCDGKRIKEIDNEPAINIYKKYLGVEEDEYFWTNTTLCPLLVEHDGVECIRVLFPCENKQDFNLIVNVENGMKVRLSYGDRITILNHVRSKVREMAKFAPETIRIYSCASRRTFWGDEEVSLETELFDEVAPTVGFYTRGEILRIGNFLHYLNATIVYSMIREGDAIQYDYCLDELLEQVEDRSSLASKLITYVGAVTNELEGQYNRTMMGIARIYKSMFLVDLENELLVQLDNDKLITQILAEKESFKDKARNCLEKLIVREYLSSALRFCDFDTLAERLGDKDVIVCELVSTTVGWLRVQFVAINRDRNGIPTQFVFTAQEIDDEKKASEEQQKIIRTLADTYNTLYVFDLNNEIYNKISNNDVIHSVYIKNQLYSNQNGLREAIKQTVSEEFLEDMLEFTDLSTIQERLAGHKMITQEFLSKSQGWIKACFIAYEKDKEGKLSKVLFVTQIIDDEKRREEKLVKTSITDELTGLLNRRAYEEALKELEMDTKKISFILASMDLNGLKAVNDDLGHSAGDELIVGAAVCLKRCLGSFGKVYRIGGDEFAAILYADEKTLERIEEDIEMTAMEWKGNQVDCLSIAYGFAFSYENQTGNLNELMKIADQRMYNKKEAYYKNRGVNRRERKKIYEMICDSYIKILRVNLTNDTYEIIKTQQAELSKSRGFEKCSLSKWLYSFAMFDQVHEEDRENYIEHTNIVYLRDYFLKGDKVFAIYYRRRIGKEFKNVIMEMVPTKEFSKENMEVFLYVKNISNNDQEKAFNEVEAFFKKCDQEKVPDKINELSK